MDKIYLAFQKISGTVPETSSDKKGQYFGAGYDRAVAIQRFI